jgi:SAM-dependent methyltransferase
MNSRENEDLKAHFDLNRNNWDKRTAIHLDSSFYDNESFLNGKSSLNPAELDLLGDVAGKKILHLQCHFGQDSISLARKGAKVTAIDLSPKAIEAANDLSQKAQTSVRFIESNVYDLPDILDDEFDIVFTSYGALPWLPDLKPWGELIHHYLKPGGQLILVEFHPLCWIYDDNFTQITYSYFNEGALHFKDKGSYTDGGKEEDIEYVAWNQPLTDVLNALLKAGMTLKKFEEYDYTPYDVFPDLIESEPRKYRFKDLGTKFPFLYGIVAEK